MTAILVIDDEAEIRDTMSRLLKQHGHSVRTARDAPSGLAEQRRAPAELVITDIIMPHGNGVEFIAELRREFPGLRIVAMSGGGNFAPQSYAPEAITTSSYLAAATEVGADQVLTKPFDRSALLAVIAVLCPTPPIH